MHHLEEMSRHLIFLHIAKNGGLTVRSILDRMYPEERVFTVRVRNNNILDTDEFLALSPRQKESLLLLQGHMDFGLHTHFPGTSEYFSFLRRPEDRLSSFYYYVRSRPQHRLYDRIVPNDLSFYDFVTTVKDSDLNNCQIRKVSGLDDTEDNMLEKALENTEKHFSFVGFQERFDESLIILKQIYGWGVPYYRKQNITKKRKSIDQLDKRTMQAIKELNRGDIELYDRMMVKFEKRVREIPNLQRELTRLSRMNAIVRIPGLYKISGSLRRIRRGKAAS